MWLTESAVSDRGLGGRRRHLAELAKYTGRDTIIYASAFTLHKGSAIPGTLMPVVLEDVQSFMSALHGLNGSELDLILRSAAPAT